MKKLYFGLIIALVLCSCAKTAPAGIETGEMIIGASMEVYPSISKAALSDTDGSLTWQTGDVIEVATSEGHAQFNLKTGAGTASATFGANYSGTLGDYATYPADIFDSELKIKIPASREWSEGNTNCSMFGSVDGDNVAFKHLGGVVKVTLNGVPAEAKKFVFSTPGKKITGEFDIKTGSGSDTNKYIETVDDEGNANSSYTLTFTLTQSRNMAFYIPLPCGTYPKFAFKLLGDDDTAKPLYEFEGISAQTVNRKDILLMPASTIGTVPDGGYLLTSVPSKTKDEYILPKADSVILYFEGKSNPGTELINLKYAEGSNLPKKLCLKVKDGNKVNISGELPNTHVEFDQGEIVTAELKTSATTFKIIAPAKISEKLVVKGGNVEIIGEITNDDNVKAIEVVADATAYGTSAPVQITLANKATVGTPEQGGEGGITTSANVVIVNNTTQEVNVTVPTDVQESVQVASAGTGSGKVKRSDAKSTTKLEAAIGTQNFFTLADAFAAVQEGQTIEITKAGTYTLPSPISNITIKGIEGVVFNAIKEYGQSVSLLHDVNFESVKFVFGSSHYTGFQHSESVTFTKCTFEGYFNSYGTMLFDQCTFNSPEENYSMWCYAGDVTYRNCTINCNGKFANLFNEGNALSDGSGNKIPWKVVAEGCTFNSTKANKAALNIKATCGSTPLYYDVEIKNCTANGENWPAASTSESLVVGSALWQVDDINASVASKIKVTVDDQVVYQIPTIQ
ncbi:MAG: hypothetical protein KBS36_04505 [Bacteroidales bacterium]|nr:hypothetical protein [Candidatus Cryptobacteroides fimicaballi]